MSYEFFSSPKFGSSLVSFTDNNFLEGKIESALARSQKCDKDYESLLRQLAEESSFAEIIIAITMNNKQLINEMESIKDLLAQVVVQINICTIGNNNLDDSQLDNLTTKRYRLNEIINHYSDNLEKLNKEFNLALESIIRNPEFIYEEHGDEMNQGENFLHFFGNPDLALDPASNAENERSNALNAYENFLYDLESQTDSFSQLLLFFEFKEWAKKMIVYAPDEKNNNSPLFMLSNIAIKFADFYQKYGSFRAKVDEYDSRFADGSEPLLNFLRPFINNQPDPLRAAVAEAVLTRRRLNF